MNLKRLAALVIGLGLGSTALWAQWSFGVKGGLNASKMKWEAMDPKFKIGAQVGGFVTYHFNDAWALQTELLYTLQGCRFELIEVGETAMEEKTIMYKRNAHYLNIPILARFQFTRRLYLELGPQVGFQLAAYQKYNDERYRIEATKPVDVALAGGVGYAFNEHLDLNFRYVHGFLPVHKYLGSDEFKATNRSMQLSLGYRF